MTVRNACTIALLLFVAVSIAAIAIKSLRPEAAAPPSPVGAGQTRQLIVYCFHGSIRCPACMGIEAGARKAIDERFAVELDTGRIRWEVVDYERPENQHFVKDFGVGGPTVVLVEMQGGERKRWKNLSETLVMADKQPALVAFLEKEVQGFLDEK
jgi:hypothetical protein